MVTYKNYQIINPYEDSEFFTKFKNGEKFKQALFLLEPNIYHIFPIDYRPPCQEMITNGSNYWWYPEAFYTIDEAKSQIDDWEKEKKRKEKRFEQLE